MWRKIIHAATRPSEPKASGLCISSIDTAGLLRGFKTVVPPRWTTLARVDGTLGVRLTCIRSVDACPILERRDLEELEHHRAGSFSHIRSSLVRFTDHYQIQMVVSCCVEVSRCAPSLEREVPALSSAIRLAASWGCRLLQSFEVPIHWSMSKCI